MIVAHVRVISRKQNTIVPGDAGDDQGSGSEIPQQRFQSGRKEPGMLRLKDKVIVFVRPQEIDDLPGATLSTMVD